MARASNFTDVQKAQLFVVHHATCVYCGAKLWLLDGGANPYYSVDWADHLVPVAKGGQSALKNGVCACYECNHKRNDNSKVPIFLFYKGKSNQLTFKRHGRLSSQIVRDMARLSKLHYSDWYFNRAHFRLLLGVHYLFNGVGVRTRDDRYYAAAALKAIKKWRRIVTNGQVTTLEVRELAPIKPSRDQKLILGLRAVNSVDDIQILMKKLLPIYRAQINDL